MEDEVSAAASTDARRNRSMQPGTSSKITRKVGGRRGEDGVCERGAGSLSEGGRQRTPRMEYQIVSTAAETRVFSLSQQAFVTL